MQVSNHSEDKNEHSSESRSDNGEDSELREYSGFNENFAQETTPAQTPLTQS